jgi:polyisoprenoid-binding protein YceI
MTWNIDPTHTQIHFSVRHMMISTVRGKFTQFAGEATIDTEDFSKAAVSATVQVDSINTSEAQRDGHLKSADFFDAEKYPTIQLKSTAVRKKGDSVEVDVDLTIRDVTKNVTLKGEVMGPAKDPWGNQRVGFSVAADVDREAFNLGWNQVLETGGVLVGKKVKIEIDAQFVQS